MKLLALQFVVLIAVLSAGVLLCDAVPMARAALRRRKQRNGAFGVVVDCEGTVLGTYLDPFAHPSRAARMHDRDSPWSVPTADGRMGCAWEGFGATEAEALRAANRLRHRHLRLLPSLGVVPGEEEDFDPLRSYSVPPWQ